MTPAEIIGITYYNRGSHICFNFQPSQAIEVQAGDVIGACIYTPTDELGGVTHREQLDVVGQNAGADRFLMVTSNSGCGDSSVPSPVSSLTRINSLVLQIYADISK